MENPKSTQPVTINVSKLALIGINLAFLGLILLILFWFLQNNLARRRNIPDEILISIHLGSLFALGGAVILGLISLIIIEISGGKTIGRNYAIGAILIPIFSAIFLLWLALSTRPRSVAFRMVCGTNLSGIGKAMLIYANDEHGELPRAGGKNGKWGRTALWDAATRYDAFGVDRPTRTGGEATISASLYLLVKYADVPPKNFICDK